MKLYTLGTDGKTPIEEPDVVKWAQWFERADRIVRQDRIGAYFISTVFLGIDHNFWGTGSPILWELMIFAGSQDDVQQRRYDSYQKALTGHQEAVERIQMAVKG